MQELKISLQPKQKQFSKSIDDTSITLFGGAKGGGKSYGLRNIFLIRAFLHPGSTGAIFRKTFPELEGNHIRPLLQQFPQLRQFWNDSKKVLNLPNGSTLEFCHCGGEKDVHLYQGREYQNLGIDESGQWDEQTFRTLLGSNRSSKANIPARVALTANPGGIGHAWLKRIFIERRFNERERSQDYNFIQALVDDNPALLENDPDYVHRLNSEPNEALRKAYRYGDWDIFAGQYFAEIRREVHLIKPFPIPSHWNRFGSYDFGFNHPAAFGWFAVDEDGNVYLYRELIKAQLRVDQFAQELTRFDDTALLNPIVAGWDCWVMKGILKAGSAPTIAEEFGNHGIHIKKAVIDRVQGASQVRNFLAWQGKPNNTAKFFIFDSCPHSFDALTRMQVDPDRPEDVLKVDAVDGDPQTGDDAYDMIRMGLMSRPMVTDRLPVRLKPGSPELIKFTENKMNENLEIQIQLQQQEEGEMDSFMTAGLDEPDALKYYLEKRK